MRPSGRALDQLRAISLETNVNKHAEGSCLAKFGDTHVLCTASVEDRVPSWLRDAGHGWVTAEYGMLPRATGDRMGREAARGKPPGGPPRGRYLALVSTIWYYCPLSGVNC